MGPPVGTGGQTKIRRGTRQKKETPRSDSEGGNEGPASYPSIYDTPVETPAGSGLFDTDEEDQAETELNLDFEEDREETEIPYEPTPDLVVGVAMGIKREPTEKRVSKTSRTDRVDTSPITTGVDTVVTRTVMTPSCVSCGMVQTTVDSQSQSTNVTTFTCATTDTGSSSAVSPTPTRPRMNGDGDNTGWTLGTPYFRNDGPHDGSTRPPDYGPGQQIDYPALMQYPSSSSSAGQYGPMSLVNQQEDYVNRYNQELLRQYHGGTMMTNPVPMFGTPSPPSSGRNSPYMSTRSPLGNCTPMADVGYGGWAQLPGNYTMTAQQAMYPNNEGDCITDYPTPLAKPQPKRKRKRAQDQHIHGERVMIAADAMRLWSRLDEDIPTGPRDPETGFGAEVIRIARRGREHTRIAMERGQASAQANWRSVVRSCRHHEGEEEELFDDYIHAVRNYVLRHDRRMQQ